MTTELTLYQYQKNNFYWDTKPYKISNFLNKKETLENKPIEILFITSYPPRECGIATYTQDLINALNTQFQNSIETSICALETDNEKPIYQESPKFILNTEKRNSFEKTLFNINRDSNIKLIIIQHEFGFFASNEEDFYQFLKKIIQPIILVFHTVLPDPDVHLKLKVNKIAHLANAIIVMTNNAANILINDYQIEPSKITIIAHGTHLIPALDKKNLKKKYQLNNQKILSTFGLLGESKSIETTLHALPEIIKKNPDVLFLILGKTHPTIIKNEGESYRNMLEETVKKLKIEKNVRFVNEYLPLPVLLEYLQLTDIYLFTSKDRNQAVSGTFSYAVSSGCPVISTPILHAKEVLSNDNGIIFDFENSVQLSKAVNSLLENEKLRQEISLHSFHQMAETSWQNSAIKHALLIEKLNKNEFELKYELPNINLNHLKRLTTNFGMIQFSKISNPDIKTGFTLDDNARALIAFAKHYDHYRDEKDIRYIEIYLQFIKFCFQDNFRFLNYVNEHKDFTQQNFTENLEDSNGRAIWALGYLCSLAPILPIYLYKDAEILFQKTLLHLDKIHSTRAMAFIIKGLHYHNKQEDLYLIVTFANRLLQMYKHEKSSNWHWYENYLTYGNSLLPEAMLCASISTQNNDYKKVALESFDFLLSKIFINNRLIVISNKGWAMKDKENNTEIGGEQPIDVAYTILALEKFYAVFQKESYKQKAILGFNWFLGVNHLCQIIYNPCTGGCYDGLEEHNVNLNQGAESTVSYLMARLAMDKILTSKKEVIHKVIKFSVLN